MPDERNFSLFVFSLLAAILLSRIWNAVLGNASILFLDSEIHHIYLGILLVLVSGFYSFFPISDQFKSLNFYLFGFGTGLVLDELAFLAFTPDTHQYYFSSKSFFGAAILTLILLAVFFVIYERFRKEDEE